MFILKEKNLIDVCAGDIFININCVDINTADKAFITLSNIKYYVSHIVDCLNTRNINFTDSQKLSLIGLITEELKYSVRKERK